MLAQTEKILKGSGLRHVVLLVFALPIDVAVEIERG